MDTPFDVMKLTREEHLIYDRLRGRSNDFGKAEVDRIFATLVGLRENCEGCDDAERALG